MRDHIPDHIPTDRPERVLAQSPIERSDAFMASLGVEVYRVGGSVRDELFAENEGRPVKAKDADYIVCGVSLERLGGILRTAGKGRIVKKLMLRDGRQAGWRINGVEIVLPRREVSTGPGHRDFAIEIDPDITLDEDAQRRDFTFNALYRVVGYDQDAGPFVPLGTVYDPLGTGKHDLFHRTIQTTHPDSFRDDPLRILRALRFVSTLGWDLSMDTQQQMVLHASAVTGLSATGHVSGTVFEEMSKILMGDDVRKALRIARDTGVLDHLFPELSPMLGFEQNSRYHDLTTDEHVFAALATASKVNAPLRVRWALLFHDSGKPESMWIDDKGRSHFYAAKDGRGADHEVVGERIWRETANRIGTSSKVREEVARLIRDHMVPLDSVKRNKVRKMRVKYGDSFLRDLVMHRACDCSGKGKLDPKQFAALRKIAEFQQAAIDAGVPASVNELAIDGHDLLAAGFLGRQIRDAQESLLHDVICGQVENEKDALLSRVA